MVEKRTKKCFKCDYCSLIVTSKKRLSEHVKTHQSIYKCVQCPQVFETTESLSLHQQFQHVDNGKSCKLCHRSFTDSNSLARHVTQFHANNETFNHCEECNVDFSDSDVLNRHQQSCLYEPRCFPCRKCDSFWNSSGALKLHYFESHPNHEESNTSIEICAVCGNVCEDFKALESHWKQWHLTTEVFNCEFCDRQFYAQGSLDNHTFKVHKIQTSFCCELCDFSCNKRVQLEAHIQSQHANVSR